MAAKASCQVTIADITDAYSVVLTSETYTFMGNTSGAPIGSACTTQAIAYQGDTQCSKVIIGTISCPTGISASVSNNGMASPTITFKTTAVISTACEASVPVIIDGITIYKKFSFAVANQGAGFGWNLVRNSKLSDGTKHIVAEDVAINVVDDSAYGKALSVIPVSGKRIYWNVEKVWVANATYTVSFIAKASVAGQKIRPSRSCVDYGEDISLSTVYKQYTTQILSTATVDGGTLSFSFSNATGDITITNVKLEKGTKATEWTPHPDDLVGDTGKGIKSTAITYQASTSGTTVPTGTWSGSIPTVSAGQYLWVRTIFSYSDNTTSTIYSVSRMGANGATGTNGKSIGSVVNYYLATTSSSGVTAATSGWTTAVQSVSAAKKYLWNYEVVKYTDGTVASTTAPCVIGSYGDQGSKGDKGDKGDKGTDGNSALTLITNYSYTKSEIDIYSANGYSGTWNVESTSGVKTGDTVFLRVMNTSINGYCYITAKVTRVVSATSLICASTGTFGKGDTGSTGNGIKSIAEHYAVSTSNSTVPTSWSSTVPTMTESNKYLWNYETITYTNGTMVDTTKRVIGVYGNKGTTGATGSQGYSLVANVVRDAFTESQWATYGTINHEETWSSTSGIRNGCRIGDMFAIVGTATDTKNAHVAYYRSNTASGDLKGLCISHTIIPRGATGATGSKGDKGDTGASGKGVKSTAVTYQASSSGTTIPTGVWSATPPATSADKPYFWTRTIITYTDNTTSTAYNVGSTPEGIVVGGRNLAMNTNKGTTGWSWSMQTGGYSKESVSETGVNTCKLTRDSVKQSGWSVIQFSYIGRTKWEADTNYTVSVDVKASVSTSMDPGFRHGDSSNMLIQSCKAVNNKTVANVWTKLVWVVKSAATLPSGTSQNTYFTGMNSNVGVSYQFKNLKIEKGNTATDWTPAPEDYVSYVDVEYYLSTSPTSLSGGSWSTIAPTWVNGKYMWSRTVTIDGSGNKTYSPNQNGVCIAGAQGATGAKGDKGDKGETGATGGTGATGNGVKSIVEQYYKSTSATSLNGGSWGTTYPGWENGKYIWTRSVITYTDNTSSTTTAVCVTGTKGDKGDKGDKGATGHAALQVKRNWSGTYVTVGQTATAATGDFNRTPVAGDVFIALDGSSNTGTWLVTNVSGTTVSIKLLAYVNSKGDAGADGNSVCTLTTNYSYTQAEIDKYSADNYSGIWAVTSTNGARVGDLVFLRVTNKTKNGYSYILAKITSIVSSTSVKCTSTGSIDKGEQGAKGDQGSKGDKGESDIKCYKLRGGSNQVVWSKLGTLVSDGDNSNFVVTIYTGDGYNGNAYQNSKAEIVIKDAWQSSASTTSAFGVSVTRQNCENLKVQVRAIASNKCELWVYLPWTYSWGTYTIAGKYTSWIEGSVTQTTEPTDGTVQKLEYRMNPENAAKTATNWMEFNEGTGLEIGDKSSGSWSGYRTKITSSTFEILNKAGTTLASYGEKLIQLGKNAKDAVIELCGGVGKILVETKSGNAALSIQSEYVDIKGVHESVLETSSSSGSCIAGAVDDSFVVNTYSDANNKANFDIGNGSIILESKKKGYQAEVEFYGCGWYGGVYTGAFAPTKAYSEKIMLGDSGRVWERLIVKNSPQVTSDRRAKTNIFPLGESKINKTDIHSELFDRLKPVQYRMIDGDGRICYGFVAQDVVEAMRELGIREDELDLVHHDRKNTEDSYIDTYSMVYTNLIAIITHELQLEKQRRSNLEVEVADLRSELESMRDNISGDTN